MNIGILKETMIEYCENLYALTNINDIINYYNSCKTELNKEKRELQAKL